MIDTVDCATCRHAHIASGIWICTHEKTAQPVNGIFKGAASVQPSCEVARLPENICGAIARLFEPRTATQ